VHRSSRRPACTRPTGRRRRLPPGRQQQRRRWQRPTRQRPELPFPDCNDRHAPNPADLRIRGGLIAAADAAATHRTGLSVRIAQDEGRCRRRYSPPWSRCRRAVSACEHWDSRRGGDMPNAEPRGSPASPRGHWICRGAEGPMALTRPRSGLLSGHKPVEGRTVRRLPWCTKLHCLLRAQWPICRRDGTSYDWLPSALTIMTSKSAGDTSGESASVLLSHGADRRWSSCGGMSDWCHVNSFALGERSLSRCNTRVPRRVPVLTQAGARSRVG
jgi:hypothetical protein